jgi:molecular chaperone DnaJ
MATKAFKDKLYVLEEFELYTILGVEKNISHDELLAHYNDLVKKYHPARTTFQLVSSQDLKENKLIFTKLSEAYNILIDSNIRNKYDTLSGEIGTSANGYKDLYKKMVDLKKEKPFKDKLYVLAEADLYVILDVAPEISNEELTKHYRQLIKKYHPDTYSFQFLSAKELKELNIIFAKITDAYNLLKDPQQRSKYDQIRNEVLSKVESNFNAPSTTDNIFKNSNIDPDKARKEQAEKFLLKGIDDYNNQSWDEAIKNFKSAIEIFRKEAKYHLYLGMAMEKKGWVDYAKSEYKQALFYDPENKIALDKMSQLTPAPVDIIVKPKKSPGLFNKIGSIFQKK